MKIPFDSGILWLPAAGYSNCALKKNTKIRSRSVEGGAREEHIFIYAINGGPSGEGIGGSCCTNYFGKFFPNCASAMSDESGISNTKRTSKNIGKTRRNLKEFTQDNFAGYVILYRKLIAEGFYYRICGKF